MNTDPHAEVTSAIKSEFIGTAAELLELVESAEGDVRRPRDWPRTSRTVTGIVKRNAPALRKAGWIVDDLGADNKQHATQWQLTPPEIVRISTSPTSPTSPNPARGEVASEESNEYGTSQVDDPGYCSHGMTIGVRCSKCGGVAA